MIEFTDIDLRTDILAARYVKTEIVEVAFAEQSGELASPEGLNCPKRSRSHVRRVATGWSAMPETGCCNTRPAITA